MKAGGEPATATMSRPGRVSFSQWLGTVRTGRRRWLIAALTLLGLWAGFRLALRWVPFPEQDLQRLPTSVLLTDRDGQLMRVKLGVGDFDCSPGYRPDPEHWVVKALVAVEDRRFWQHAGLDPLALGRAALQNVLGGRRISGASTLSTQVIRMAQPRRRNWSTKAIEAFRALQLEQRHSKEEILTLYLDRAPFGGNIVGVEAATRRYFDKSPAELSLGEAALLAGLPQAPSRFRPDRNLQRARVRQSFVLERMVACGYITAAQQAEAQNQMIAISRKGYSRRAPHFCDLVGVPTQPTRQSGTVRTTLDPSWQTMAEELLQRQAEASGFQGGALVVIEVKTGAVRALAGSPDYDEPTAGQVNGAMARRAAGSTLKPFAYALAFDRGLMTPATMLSDAPISFRDFSPANFARDYRGKASARDSLVLSLNLPAIDVVRRIGIPRFHATLRDLGLTTLKRPPEHYGIGLALGGTDVRLLELANAYAVLARGGEWMPLRLVESDRIATTKRIFSEEACWLVNDILSGEERARDATGHAADVRLPDMVWKTGTSAGLRDAWTVAWNPEVVIGVWIGNPDGSSSEELVGRLAATPLAWDMARLIYPGNLSPGFKRPAGIVPRTVCAASGCTPGSHCEHRITDWGIAKVSRHIPCPLHQDGRSASALAAAAAGKNRQMAKAETGPAASLRILSPPPNSAYRRFPDASGWQQLTLDATSDRPGERLHWFINDRPVGQTYAGQQLRWPLESGIHEIVCASARGVSDRVHITVE